MCYDKGRNHGGVETMDVKKELLLRSAARLYSVGIDLEGARERIRQLVDRKADYESCEMIQAVQDYTEIKKLWHDLEEEYLALRREITGESC